MGDPGSIPGLGRSLREGNGYPLQFSGLENPMDCIETHKESDTTETFISLHTCVYIDTHIGRLMETEMKI